MNKKIVLYFGSQEHKRPFVERILQDMKIPYAIIHDEQLLDTTGYLMELEGFQSHEEGVIPHYDSDLMILNSINDEEIKTFNTLLKAFNLQMPRKAMLTQHNQHWKVADLLQEIEKEHRYFQQVEQIKTILSHSKDLIIEEYTPTSWNVYEQAFYKAYDCISKECSPEEMQEAYQQLTDALQQLNKKLH